MLLSYNAIILLSLCGFVVRYNEGNEMNVIKMSLLDQVKNYIKYQTLKNTTLKYGSNNQLKINSLKLNPSKENNSFLEFTV